jgi:hypothetical protein
MRQWYSVLCGLSGLLLGAFLGGCTPHIGDKCNVNSDCSIQGNLQCDTSQLNGYCTVFNCTPTNCPNNAACVTVNASVPGCPYDDYQSPSRTALNMCLQSCTKDSDCRTSDGYACVDPTLPPWNAVIVDNVIQRVCLQNPSYSIGTDASFEGGVAPVCQPRVTIPDGSVFPVEDTGAGVESEAGADAQSAIDAGNEAGEVDAGSDAADAAEMGAADAPDGG